MGNTFYFGWEMSLMEWLQAHIGGAAISIISTFSMFGEPFLSVLILGFFYWCYDKKFGKEFGLNIIVASLWNPMIKSVFNRRRPYFDNAKLQVFRQVSNEGGLYDIASQGYSFPSGHSTNAAAIFATLAFHFKKRWSVILAIILPLLVGFSRVFVGVHYPTDVLCGWLQGLLSILILRWLSRIIPNRSMLHILLLLICLPGFFYSNAHDYYTSYGMLLGYVLAIPFEEKYVNFEGTKNILRCILRLAGGGMIYFGLNAILKLPFSSAFLDSATFLAHFVRTLRYAIVVFTDIALYPMVFKYTARIGKAAKK